MTHPYDPRMREEEEKKKLQSRDRIARSQVQQQQLARKQGPGSAPIASPGGNPLMQIGKALAGNALGPLGPLAGLFFNKGGNVPMKGYNTGGWLTALFGQGLPMNPNRRKVEEEKRRRQQSGQPSILEQINWWGGKKQQQPARRNMGGPIANPMGYNEGGSVQETPIKKVMDEQKLDQQAKAFELEQQRKAEKHSMEMQQKKQQFATQQKMKQEAATTSKKPKAPLAKK